MKDPLKIISDLQALSAERARTEPAYLPTWPQMTRGTPNAWLRGALFAAIQGKERRALKRELLASVEGVEIRFTGWQLDQSDLDVWETLVHLCRTQQLGARVEVSGYGLLKALGRSAGSNDYEWLKDAVARLYSAGVEITAGGYSYFGALLKGARDEKTGHYIIELEPRLLAMYQAGWTQIDWLERQVLRRKPLALWLHGWFCSHARPYPIKIETVHRLCGSKTVAMWKFKQMLARAMDTLQSVGAIDSWEFDGDLVRVARSPTRSQQKHLEKKLSTGGNSRARDSG